MSGSFITAHTATNSKASGTTLNMTLASSVPAGRVIALAVSMDNTSATAPTVSTIGVQSGETASWTRIISADASSATAGGALRAEVWVLKTTVTWAAGNYTITFSATIGSKSALPGEFAGTLTTLRSTSGAGSNVTATSATATTTGTAPVVGDIVLGIGANEDTLAPGGDTDTTGGAWVDVGTAGTTGGTAATNVFLRFQYKITTATTAQQYQMSTGTSDGSVGVAVLQQLVATDLNLTAGAAPVMVGAANSTLAISLDGRASAAPVMVATPPSTKLVYDLVGQVGHGLPAIGTISRGNMLGVDYTINEVASGTTLSAAMPTAAAAGKFVHAHVTSGQTGSITAPDGTWTLLPGTDLLPTNQHTAAYRKRLVGGEGATTWTQAATARFSVILTVMDGIDPTTPMDVATAASATSPTGTPLTIPQVTPVTNGALLVSGASVDAATAATLVATSPLTLYAQSVGTGKRNAIADETFVTAGPTGTRQWTLTGTTNLAMGGYLAVYRPVINPTPLPAGPQGPVMVAAGSATLDIGVAGGTPLNLTAGAAPVSAAAGNSALVLDLATDVDPAPVLIAAAKGALVIDLATDVDPLPIQVAAARHALAIALATDVDPLPVMVGASRSALAVVLATDVDPAPILVGVGDSALQYPLVMGASAAAVLVASGSANLQFPVGTPLNLTAGALPVVVGVSRAALVEDLATAVRGAPVLVQASRSALAAAIALGVRAAPVPLSVGGVVLSLGGGGTGLVVQVWNGTALVPVSSITVWNGVSESPASISQVV